MRERRDPTVNPKRFCRQCHSAVGREHPRFTHRVTYRLRQHVHGTLATCHLFFAAPNALSRFPGTSDADRGVTGCSLVDSDENIPTHVLGLIKIARSLQTKVRVASFRLVVFCRERISHPSPECRPFSVRL